MRLRRALVALAVVAAALALAAAPAGAAVAEFTPSIVMTNFGEMGAPCLQMVDNAAKLNANQIKFVPTVHYYGSESRIDSYCYRNENWGCEDVTPESMRRYRDLLAKCISYAVDKYNVDVAILAHLDNMKEYTWRNLLQFSPLVKYGGYSYKDAVLRPMADAVNKAAKPGTRVVFTLNGETGKSVSQYSKHWLDLVPVARGWLMAGGKLPRESAQIAVSLNYNKLYGWIDFDSISPDYIAKNFDKEWKEQVKKYPMDLPNMKRLYDAIDVIGLSAYPPLYPNFKSEDLQVALQYHSQELSYAGINLKQLLDGGKKLVISEWGVGGGTEDGKSIAATVKDVAGYPFFGLWYPYGSWKDPWKRPEYAAYRRYLYRKTADWLAQGGGPTFKLDKLYVWNAGSWDALGVHFQSGDATGSWADSEIIELVKTHNAKV
ncbi:MAG: hypothetical protein J3K34DRAFT_432891 [Monoraphidium minutum]|nr:MAG: hypothetical protein J3K34DRAFT_432891 [Monoraphidium minutum]